MWKTFIAGRETEAQEVLLGQMPYGMVECPQR